MNGGRDEDAAGRHAETALQLMSRGPEHYASAIEHARLAQPLDQTRLVELLQSEFIDSVVVTDTLPLPPEKRFPSLTVLPIAPLLARAIYEVFDDGSVTSLFDAAE